MSSRHTRSIAAVTTVMGLALMASGCATTAQNAPKTDPPSNTAPRLAVGYEDGIAVLDGATLEIIDTFESEHFTRLNAAGDGRHVVVTTSAGFQLLDTTTPTLTDLVFEAAAAGHVIRHAGNTILYDDATSTTTIIDSHDLAEAKSALPESKTYVADAAHHGVSIVLADDTLLTTIGDANGRPGVAALSPHGDHWHEFARSTDCPGVHGEGTAADEAVVFGCENGALIYENDVFTKLTSPDTFGRIGNAYVSETSSIVVGDYKSDPDAEGYLLSDIALIDTTEKTLNIVELPAGVEFTYRDVARGPDDLAYILATDGSIHVLDPKSGTIVRQISAIEAWEGPAEWQDPHPTLAINGDIAYVTEPAKNSLHAISLTDGAVLASTTFDKAPNEIAVTLDAH